MTCNECREAISPYIDGELSAAESADVKAHMLSCSDCASRERAMMAIKAQLRALPRFPAPDVLKARVRAEHGVLLPTPRRQRTYATWIVLGSAAVLMLAFLSRSGRPSGDVDASAVLARHVRSLMPGNLTQVISTDQHNVKPWFNGRVDVSPPVVTMDSVGFRLVGGRVDTLAGTPAAVVVYGRRLHTINVFARPVTEPDMDLAVSDKSGFHLVHGRRQGVDLWIVSDLNRGELLDFANRLLRDY